MNEQLIDQVIEKIIEDVKMSDYTAIAELLQFVSEKNLRNYLPEMPHGVQSQIN
jgi:hypothetical protein